MTKPTVSKHWRKPSWSFRESLNPTRTTPPCYNNTTLGNHLYAWHKGPNVTNPICWTCKNCKTDLRQHGIVRVNTDADLFPAQLSGRTALQVDDILFLASAELCVVSEQLSLAQLLKLPNTTNKQLKHRITPVAFIGYSNLLRKWCRDERNFTHFIQRWFYCVRLGTSPHGTTLTTDNNGPCGAALRQCNAVKRWREQHDAYRLECSISCIMIYVILANYYI